ncbi:PEPxxWA-CTERM sorting domain-containing protein [Sphingomonas sp. JC676]|uniref:PEPxxWA-CTERM sorting domain-containing protein n=1 Tax=Sphingomonas sp. JC676 TaxID=2768065 RepID=UPI00223B2930|nr:PEPxxWA-CTERM sorting domain-containing protein [Sphingomonas sp. JC676]
MKLAIALAGTLLAVAAAAPASAQSLNFAGLNGDAQELVLEYYNGGTGSLGSGPGANYGISFSNNAIACSVQPGGSCNSGGLPTGGNLLFFLTGAASTMNVAGGFNTGFSFFYSAVNNPAFVNVYSGLNGTGTLLATLNLPVTPSMPGDPACGGGGFCPFVPIGVSFAGTALSVDFGGSANQVAFAAITINSATPGGVPEPAAWGMLIGGFGLAGAAMRTRRTKVAFAA